MATAALVALLVLFPFLLFACVSSLLFWYEAINEPDTRIPAPKPSLYTVLRQYIFAVGGYLIGVGLHPLGWLPLRRKWEPLPGAPRLGPVILIHGINDNASVWTYLGPKLAKRGFAVFTFAYFSVGVPMERIVERLDALVRTVEAAFPGEKPLIVGHSLGGVMARAWLLEPANQRRLRGLVTLATPHGGSKIASLLFMGLGKHITPKSELIGKLAHASLQEPLPCVSLVTPTDEAVLPASALVPPGGWKLRLVNPVSHFGILMCPRVAKILLEELETMIP